jgi:hypothetical protein
MGVRAKGDDIIEPLAWGIGNMIGKGEGGLGAGRDVLIGWVSRGERQP